jgi:hypothetical protein
MEDEHIAYPLTDLERFWSDQRRITTSLASPENQLLATLAIFSGVVSSLALARLYTQLSKEKVQSPVQLMAGRGLTAMVVGVGYVWWELNKAQSLSDAADLSDEDSFV